MRAASATGAAASAATAAARGAVPSAAGAGAGSNQFSNLLVGATAPASAATGQPSAAAQNPAPVNSDAGSGSDASGNAPACTPAVGTGNTAPAPPLAAAVVTVTTATNATSSPSATSASGATAASATAASAAATAPPAATAAPGEPDSAQATVPAPLSATTGNTAATPRPGKNDSAGGTKGASHRSTASDEADATAGQVTVLPMWLLVQTLPASIQDPNGDSATGNSSDNASALLDGAAAASLATRTPVATPAFAPAAANSAAAASPVAAAAGVLTSAVAASGAAALAAATAISDSGLNSSSPNSQFDGEGNADATSSDHTGAAATVANADLSALASLARGLPGGAVQSGSVEHSIPVPVSDQNWPRAVAAQVQLFAAANVQNATLRLSPAHLGPVEVHIDVQASQINVSFVAAHADTRSALEQALPTLRALLAHGGLTLGQAQVQGESRSASQLFNARAQGVFGATPEDPATAGPARAVGLIDEYA